MVSRETIGGITDKLVEVLTDWQNRPLDQEVYAAVFIDLIMVKVRDGHIANPAPDEGCRVLTAVASEFTTFAADEVPSALACLTWRLREPMLVSSTAAVGGGIGMRDWVVNVQVPIGYARRDLEAHVAEIARVLRLAGPGVGMLTAVEVARVAVCDEEPGVRVEATVGLSSPEWAAAAHDPARALAHAETATPGTINVVGFVPVRHSHAAMANLLCTVTEAKVQALADRGIPGTGTASDAVTVLCPASGPVQPFGGPRSVWGARVARAVYGALHASIDATA